MKQHMLTHKIRDMPPHLFGDSKPPGQGTPSASQQQQQQQHDQQRQEQHQQRDQRSQDRENSPSPMCPDESSLPPPPPPPPPLPPPSSPMTPSTILEPPMPIKRSPTEGDLPAAKRPSKYKKLIKLYFFIFNHDLFFFYHYSLCLYLFLFIYYKSNPLVLFLCSFLANFLFKKKENNEKLCI